MIQLADITLARFRLLAYLQPTPLEAAPGLGSNVWLKLENANRTHSFKVRGALNAILALDDAAREQGIIAASSGNHAQGVAYAAHLLGLRARILMPVATPKRKVSGVERYGAQAILFGENYDETEAEARRMERADGLTFVSAYNDPNVAAGAGTIGMELVEALPAIERALVPVSGGGLIGGIATALKALRPGIEVIGVNATRAPAMYNFLHNAERPQVWDTLAEALSGEIEAESITFELARAHVDRIELVTEAAIARAMRWMIFEQGWIAEGGGAVGVAAMLEGIVPADERPTAIVVSGGNVDEETLRGVLNV